MRTRNGNARAAWSNAHVMLCFEYELAFAVRSGVAPHRVKDAQWNTANIDILNERLLAFEYPGTT